MSRLPHLEPFLAEVDQRLRFEEPETFWDCEPAFRQLLDCKAVQETVNDLLRELLANPEFDPEATANELVLHVGGGTALFVSSATPQRYLHVLPYHALYGVLGNTEVEFQKFDAPKDYRRDVFDPNVRLTAAETGSLQLGHALRLRAGESAFDLKGPALMLKFVTTAMFPLEWLFKRESLQAWQANDADLSFTQLRVAADVLGKIAHQSSIEPLKLMAGHGHHAVRWAAITNLGRINKTEALAKLKAAVEDPHPHIRNAATKTLRRLRP